MRKRRTHFTMQRERIIRWESNKAVYPQPTIAERQLCTMCIPRSHRVLQNPDFGLLSFEAGKVLGGFVCGPHTNVRLCWKPRLERELGRAKLALRRDDHLFGSQSGLNCGPPFEVAENWLSDIRESSVSPKACMLTWSLPIG